MTTDPAQLLPQPVLQFLNIFVVVCHYLNHVLGYGWGYLAFLALLAFACVCPGLAYWGNLIKSGMSSEKAAKQSSWVATPLFFVAIVIGVYVYYHGGNVSHPV